MRRREFIAGLGSTAAWPLVARAQQVAMPVIGYLSIGTPRERADGIEILRKGLSEMGFVESRNLAIEFRWAQNDVSRLPELAADLIRRRVAVIVTVGGAAALTVKALTNTIPVVFAINGDPVKLGIVANLNRPGANMLRPSGLNSCINSCRVPPGLARSLIRSLRAVTVLAEVLPTTISQTYERRPRRLGGKLSSSTPAPVPRSMQLSRASCKSGPTQSWS